VEVFCAGRAFVLAGGPVGKPHLFFVLTDPDPKTKKVIVVMLVTAKRYTDKTVSLVVGDHPWVRHDSDVEFGTARPMPLSKLAQALRRADLHLQEEPERTHLGEDQAGAPDLVADHPRCKGILPANLCEVRARRPCPVWYAEIGRAKMDLEVAGVESAVA
jgi:hypothetical protein